MRTLLQTQGADGIVPPNDKTKKMKKLIVYLVIAAAALMETYVTPRLLAMVL